jgi:hypothetical protein
MNPSIALNYNPSSVLWTDVDFNRRRHCQTRSPMEYRHTMAAIPSTGPVLSKNISRQGSAVPGPERHWFCLVSIISATTAPNKITGPSTITDLKRPGRLGNTRFSTSLIPRMSIRAGKTTKVVNKQNKACNVRFLQLCVVDIPCASLSDPSQMPANPKHICAANQGEA